MTEQPTTTRERIREIVFEADTPAGKILASAIMIMGYGIIAVPTGVVSVELAGVVKKRATTRACPDCGAGGHDHDATNCKYCGARLSATRPCPEATSEAARKVARLGPRGRSREPGLAPRVRRSGRPQTKDRNSRSREEKLVTHRLSLAITCCLVVGFPAFLTHAEDLAIPDEWDTLYVCFLVANPEYAPVSEQKEGELTAAHIQYQLRLQEDDRSIAAGGLGQGAENSIVGLTILRAESLAEAQEIAASDPAVSAGRLRVRVREWWVPAGRLP